MPLDTTAVDYDQLADVAHRFDSASQRTQRMLQRLVQHVDQLGATGWDSDGARTFFRDMDDDLLPAIRALALALDESSRTTLDIIRIMQAAEEEAAALFAGGAVAKAGQRAASMAKPTYTPLTSDADGGLNGAPPNVKQVIFINGIQNSPEDHRNSLAMVESIWGKPVMGIYNRTEGRIDDLAEQYGREYMEEHGTLANAVERMWNPMAQMEYMADTLLLGPRILGGVVGDLVESGNDLFESRYGVRIPLEDNPAVDQLVTQIRNHEGPLELVAHSQGAAITATALNRLSREGFDLSQVNVTTFGGAGVRFPPGVNVSQYVHADDIVPGAAAIADDIMGPGAANTDGRVTLDGSGHGLAGYLESYQNR